MLRNLSTARRNWALALLGALLIWFAWTVRAVLNPLIAGYFLAFVVHPLVMKLRKRGWSRTGAVNLIFAVATTLGLLVFVGGMLQAAHYVRTVADSQWRETQLSSLDRFLGKHAEEIEWVLSSFDVEFEENGTLDTGEIVSAVGAEWRRLTEPAAGERKRSRAEIVLAWVTRMFGSAFAAVSFVLLLPIYTYFLLFELERVHAFVARYIPRRHRPRIRRVGGQIGEVLSNFFRGRLTVCFLKGSLLAALLWLCGVKYALLLGLAGGLGSLLPFVGPALAFVAAFLVALLQQDGTLGSAFLRTGPVFLVAEAVEGYVLIPKILGESLGLHPVVVLLSVFVGGAAFGAFGVLLALPVTASLVILFREFVLPALARFADEEGPDDEGPAEAPEPEGS